MSACRWQARVERWFDGEAEHGEAVEAHVAGCESCGAFIDGLTQLRSCAQLLAAKPEIADGQFPAFMQGVREKLDVPVRRFGRLWALMSLSAAALVVALSTFFVMIGGLRTVDAKTDVELYTTDIQNATVSYYRSENGTPTVWVNMPDGDMW